MDRSHVKLWALHAEKLDMAQDARQARKKQLQERRKICISTSSICIRKVITLEVCFSSNLQTMPERSGIKIPCISEMVDHRMSITINTDNRLVTTLLQKVKMAIDKFQLTPKQLRDIVITGFKVVFTSKICGKASIRSQGHGLL